jgi:hypothetical protein
VADFINTVDVLGDEATLDGLIDGSIAEFRSDELTTIGQYARAHCNLVTIDLPNVTTVSNGSFSGCGLLETVNIPNLDSVTGSDFFASCSSLKRVCFPKITNTGTNGFRGCESLEVADFTALTTINGYCFEACYALIALIIRNPTVVVDLASTGLKYMGGCGITSGTGYVYVPKALVDSYKAATNWSTYADQFRALEDYTVDGTITGELDETKI